MQTAPLPFYEQERLAELKEYDILDTQRENEFDQLTELIKHITHCPYVAISFVDKDRQWFKSSIGLDFSETPRDISFCSHTILDNRIMVVPDSHTDERFFDNPLVTEGVKVRFYAGAPIVSGKGQHLGAVCVFDSVTRSLNDEQLRALEIVSLQVTRLLELRIKNKLILERSARLVETERKIVEYTINEQEKERQSIGVELHENFAQIVAVCLMYLNLANDAGYAAQPFIQNAKKELNTMLGDMRRLSRSYNPLNFPYVDLKLIIEQSIDQATKDSSIKVKLFWTGDADNVSSNMSLNISRIITQYLKFLSENQDISTVLLRVNAGEKIELQVIDDGKVTEPCHIYQHAAFNSILSRIRLCNGVCDLKTMGDEGTIFIARLPADDVRKVA